MSKILHVVNNFDPAGAVVRIVQELNKFSRHQHEVIVKREHPFNVYYGFQQSALLESNTDEGVVDTLFDWADAVLYHFAGAEKGWKQEGKPSAFVSHCVYFSAEKGFHSPNCFTAQDLEFYDLFGASHVGSRAFLPGAWHLPALLNVHDPLLQPDWSERKPCVSISKGFDVFGHFNWLKNGLTCQCVSGINRPELLDKRRRFATIVLDNITDGHYGLAGIEAMAMGLPVVVFNHPDTRSALSLVSRDYPPFIECQQNVLDAVRALKENATPSFNMRQTCYEWVMDYYNSARLVPHYWDEFCNELLSIKRRPR